MPILALILTLSQGAFEIRHEGTFNTQAECIEHFKWRQQHSDFRRGDVSGSCVARADVENWVKAMFGGRA
jgi:hypothetical protein